MFKFIIIAVTIAIVNAGSIGLHHTPTYSDATAVSSVYNSILNNGHQQHESYISKGPATTLGLQHSIEPTVQLNTAAGLQHHQHSAPLLKLHHSTPTAVLRSHIAPAAVQFHSVPTAVKLHSPAPAVKIHSAPVINLHSEPHLATVHHSAPAVNIIKVQNQIPKLKLSSAAVHDDNKAEYYQHEIPSTYTRKQIHYSLAPEVSHVSFDGYGTHYAW